MALPPPFDTPDHRSPDEAPRTSVADVALCVYAAVAELAECGGLAQDGDDLVLINHVSYPTAALATFARLTAADRDRIRHPEADDGLLAVSDGLLEDLLGIAGGARADRSVVGVGLLRCFFAGAGVVDLPSDTDEEYLAEIVDAARRLPPSRKHRPRQVDAVEFGLLSYLAGQAAALAIAGEHGSLRLRQRNFHVS